MSLGTVLNENDKSKNLHKAISFMGCYLAVYPHKCQMGWILFPVTRQKDEEFIESNL